MNANELADLYDAPYEYPEWGSKAQAMLRQQQEKIAIWKESFYNSVSENGKLREAIRQQQAEIEALKNGLSSAYWHDTFVEVKKPNSDLIYRFKLDDVCNHGVDDGACKECYMEAQEK